MVHWKSKELRFDPVKSLINGWSTKSEGSVCSVSDTGKKVAVIGAGPAGYTAAQELSKNGYSVDIFDKESRICGAIYTGIPEYRMSKAFLDKVYDVMTKDANITFHFDTKIDGKAFAELRQNYDKVLIATGAQIENTYDFTVGQGLGAGLTLLYDLNILGKQDDYKKYKEAVVWGGGNVAMDCARSLIRIIDRVTVVYRRSEAEMPANKSEIRDARNEHVDLEFLSNIKEIIRDTEGNVTGAEVIKMELGEPDESGRRSPHEIPGSEYVLPADLIIMAIGQKVDLSVLDETLAIEDNFRTNLENVYIAGDANVGPATIGKALMEGKAAAAMMQKPW